MLMESDAFFDGINPEPRFAVLSPDGTYLGCVTERAGFAHRFFAEGASLCAKLGVKSWRNRSEAEAAIGNA